MSTAKRVLDPRGGWLTGDTVTRVAGETATQLLHRLTSYEPNRDWTDPIADLRVVQDLVVNDFDRLPRFYKEYGRDLPRRALPRDWPEPALPATRVLAGAVDVPVSDIDLPALSRLLFLSAGVTRTAERRGRRFLFRAAGSAGARFPLELYVAVPDGTSLPAGVHWYDPADHALVQVGPAPDGGAPTVVLTGVPWRTGWRYRERGFRHIYWDAGTMLAQLLAAADSAGIVARLYTRFPDGAVADLVGAHGRQEFPVALVGLGAGDPGLTAGGPAARGLLDEDAVEFPLVTSAQRAGFLESLDAEVPRGAPVPAAGGARATLDEIVLRRGSTRLMDPGRSVPRSWLVDSMAAAMRGVDVPHWVAVSAVDDLEPGLYKWPALTAPIRTGNLRAELYRVSLEQGLARDAAFVVISAVELCGVDDRRYREVQLLSGVVEGRLHLMAYALGAGASGMTFQDSDIADLLGQDLACLLWTCVGVAEYQGRRGGRPGAPTAIGMVKAPR